MPEYTTLLRSEYEGLRVRAARVEEIQAALDDALRHRDRLAAEFTAYKAKVRELAIETADDEGWCAEGLNRALVELDLDPRMFRYQVTVNVRATQEVQVEVEAENEDAAHDKAMELDSDDLRSLCDSGEWDVEVDDTSYVDLLGAA